MVSQKELDRVHCDVARNRINWAASDAKRDEGLKEPSDVNQYKDISYGNYGKENLLDIFIPLKPINDSADENGRYPVLLNVHGGGYFYGDKELYRFYAMDMARYGFTVVSFNYRLSPESTFPAPLEDTNAVLYFVKKHSEEYKMDLNRIFLMGDSAGAQIASQYGAINSNPDYAKLFSFVPADVKVKGLALACGMYDVLKGKTSKDSIDFLLNYLGEDFDSDDKRLDVCAAVSENFPESFLFSCPNDYLFGYMEPMTKLINDRGSKATMKIYGTAQMKEIAHVFHCNMNMPLSALARKEQAEFLLSL